MLPSFRYHPDPIASGSVTESDAECRCCNKARGYIYAGPVYSEEELDEALCPWCIHDGSAHAEFAAEFTDAAGVGGDEETDEVPKSVIEEVAFRTPGFTAWQQERWLTCCGDAAAFIGPAGAAELKKKWPEFVAALRAETELEDDEWEEFFEALDIDGGPTAYLFRCLHCAKPLAYADCD